MTALVKDLARGADTERGRALLAFATKLTTLTAPVDAGDIEPLRAAGLDDDGVRDLVQVAAYFNYVNRHVIGLGVELEENHPGRRWAELGVGSP